MKKYYKRWHEHCKSEAPDDKPHYKPGVASLKGGWITSLKDFKKLFK